MPMLLAMPAGPEKVARLPRRREPVLTTPRRQIAISAIRVVVVNALLIALYWSLPFGKRLNDRGSWFWLGLGLVGLVAVTGWELRTINRSRFPEVRAIEAGGIALPVALLPFAATYYILAADVAGSFDGHLTRLDAFYFTITTFATVGFGDIVPRSEAARAVVTGQMVVDLLLLGFIAKALIGTARRRRTSLVEEESQG